MRPAHEKWWWHSDKRMRCINMLTSYLCECCVELGCAGEMASHLSMTLSSKLSDYREFLWVRFHVSHLHIHNPKVKCSTAFTAKIKTSIENFLSDLSFHWFDYIGSPHSSAPCPLVCAARIRKWYNFINCLWIRFAGFLPPNGCNELAHIDAGDFIVGCKGVWTSINAFH